MKRILLAGIAVLLALLMLFAILPSYTGDNNPQNISRACFGSECFSVELALTPEQLSRGLMGRAHLDPDKGMLFMFSEDEIYPFWMKDTLIPLDIIWMDSSGKVVFLAKDAQPCGPAECPLINPGTPARYVLEVNAGAADRIGLGAGDAASISIASP